MKSNQNMSLHVYVTSGLFCTVYDAAIQLW